MLKIRRSWNEVCPAIRHVIHWDRKKSKNFKGVVMKQLIGFVDLKLAFASFRSSRNFGLFAFRLFVINGAFFASSAVSAKNALAPIAVDQTTVTLPGIECHFDFSLSDVTSPVGLKENALEALANFCADPKGFSVFNGEYLPSPPYSQCYIEIPQVGGDIWRIINILPYSPDNCSTAHICGQCKLVPQNAEDQKL